jgi:multiple sugar transport system substrate-binding protein
MQIGNARSGLSRRHALGLGLGAAAAAALSACGGSDGGSSASGSGGKEYTGPKVDLAMWTGFTGRDGDIMRKLIDRFNAEHANIAVAMSVNKWEEYYLKLPAAVSSGNGPDLGVMHVDQLATNAARNAIIPLDDVANTLQLSENDFNPVVWKAGVYKDKRYGIPLDMHPLGFFYNKALMTKAGLDPEKPPQTKDDYAAALAELKAAGIQGQWMTPWPFTGIHAFQSLLWQHGGSLFNEDTTEAAYNSDAGIEALSWMVALVTDGHSARDVGQDADYLALKNGKTAFNWNGPWQINDLKQTPGLEWGVAPLPQIGTEKAAWAGSHNFAVMQQRKPDQNKIDAAKVFINWLGQRSLDWAAGGQIPARKAVREEAGFAQYTEVSTLAKQVDYVRFPPPVPGIGEAMITVETLVNEAVLGKKSPKQALDDAAGQAKKILEENRKKYGS